jgi:hypothetical protein
VLPANKSWWLVGVSQTLADLDKKRRRLNLGCYANNIAVRGTLNGNFRLTHCQYFIDAGLTEVCPSVLPSLCISFVRLTPETSKRYFQGISVSGFRMEVHPDSRCNKDAQ